MRTALVVAAFALYAPTATAADGPIQLELEVGQRATVGGASGLCDDLSVATITLNEPAVITAVKPGTTTCSARVGGLRRVYQVKVVAAQPSRPQGGAPGGAPAAPRQTKDPTQR